MFILTKRHKRVMYKEDSVYSKDSIDPLVKCQQLVGLPKVHPRRTMNFRAGISRTGMTGLAYMPNDGSMLRAMAW